MSKLETVVIYEGPSLIDGAPIVVFAQRGSRNTKTGGMLQTFIVRADIDPLEASRTGQDRSICGDCVHRGKPSERDSGVAVERSCYVTLMHAPLNKFKTWKRGRYETITGHDAIKAFGAGQLVRIGSYGDGAAVPSFIWDSLCEDSKGWTAYTHQDQNDAIKPDPARYMTSADSLDAAARAWSKGERTFRVINDVAEVQAGKEILCPASKEAGARTTCATCKLCAGTSIKAKSVAIVDHGPQKTRNKKAALSMRAQNNIGDNAEAALEIARH